MKTQFPIRFTVTEDIIKKAKTHNVHECIGALSLLSVLGENDKFGSWAAIFGHVTIQGDMFQTRVWSVDPENGRPINMMEIKTPREIIFTTETPENVIYSPNVGS